MSVSIRLAKFGKRHSPSYRIVATTTRYKRGGKFIELLGHYNPLDKSKGLVLNKEALAKWIGRGALVSSAVKKLSEGTYEYKKYIAKKAATKEAAPTEQKSKPEEKTQVEKAAEEVKTE